jgi:hypothetical protein
MATNEQAQLASASAYKRKLNPADVPQGYTLDAQASGRRAKAFVNNDTKNVLIAHRGTSGLADEGTELSAVIGEKETEQAI